MDVITSIVRRRSSRLAAIGVAALVGATLIVGFQLVSAWRASRSILGELRGTPVVPERSAPAATLVDHNGKPAALIDPAFRATFVFFGYTNCKDTCPVALARLAKAYGALLQPELVRVEMVTVDPARDDPTALRAFVTRFDRRFIGLTAWSGDGRSDEAALEKIWSAFGVGVDSSKPELVHGDGIYLVDRARRILTIYPPDADPADLAHDARIIAGR